MSDALPIVPREKPLPADIHAEQATLGSIFLDREAIIPVAPWLEVAHFYNEKHGWIYEAQLACYNRRTPPDLVNVADELRRQDRLELVGGVAYLTHLSNCVPTAYHVEYYAKIVERTGLERRLIEIGGKIAALGYNATGDIEETVEAAEAELAQLSQRRASSGFISAADAVARLDRRVEAAHERGAQLAGVATGFPDLDDLLCGMQPGDLLILAARPAVGKTSLATCIANAVASRGETVAFISLEMPTDQVIGRLVSIRAGIDMQSLLSGQVAPSDPALVKALGDISMLPLVITEDSMTSTGLRGRLRALNAMQRLDLIVVDYLQLLGGRGGNREQEVASVSRDLKAIAMELKVPVLALSQMSRSIETRSDPTPQLSDLRESGSLEQDASVVMFIHREELYDPMTDKKGLAELHVAKNRNGPTGISVMRFFKSTTKFAPLDVFHVPEDY